MGSLDPGPNLFSNINIDVESLTVIFSILNLCIEQSMFATARVAQIQMFVKIWWGAVKFGVKEVHQLLQISF